MNNNEKVKLFVCYHKEDKIFNVSHYFPIHVGKKVSHIDLGILGDDTGDNISDKNQWYCELTAQYWIWKNVKDVDYVGLCHYRRYFDFNSKFIYKFRPYFHSENYSVVDMIKFSSESLNQFDVILPRIRSISIPIFESLCISHIKKDVLILEEIVKELYPNYYDDFKKVIINGNKYTPCNMLVAKKNIFDDYSKWLFDILFEFEKRLSIPMNPYQPRLMGYYSERLLSVYFHHHREYRINYLPLVLLDNEINKSLIGILIREKFRSLSCKLYKYLR